MLEGAETRAATVKSVWKLLRITKRDPHVTQRNPSQYTIDTHIRVYCCTVHSQDVRPAKVLINARVDKAREAHVHSEMLFIQRNRVMSFAGKWSELESILLMK